MDTCAAAQILHRGTSRLILFSLRQGSTEARYGDGKTMDYVQSLRLKLRGRLLVCRRAVFLSIEDTDIFGAWLSESAHGGRNRMRRHVLRIEDTLLTK
jgi:hypothetical protein